MTFDANARNSLYLSATSGSATSGLDKARVFTQH
jgi:hypothetical protein